MVGLVALKHNDLHRAPAVLVVHAHELEGAGAPLVLRGVDSLPQVQQHALARVVNVLDDVGITTKELAIGCRLLQAKRALFGAVDAEHVLGA